MSTVLCFINGHAAESVLMFVFQIIHTSKEVFTDGYVEGNGGSLGEEHEYNHQGNVPLTFHMNRFKTGIRLCKKNVGAKHLSYHIK